MNAFAAMLAPVAIPPWTGERRTHWLDGKEFAYRPRESYRPWKPWALLREGVCISQSQAAACWKLITVARPVIGAHNLER